MKHLTSGEGLYTRRDGVVRGPYTTGQVTRYMLLGRIRLDDELSRDQYEWSPAEAFANLVPDELVALESWADYQRLIEARLRADERRGERRCTDCPNYVKCRGERRSGSERRVGGEIIPERRPGARDTAQHSQEGRPSMLRTLLLSLLLATLVFAWLVPVEY